MRRLITVEEWKKKLDQGYARVGVDGTRYALFADPLLGTVLEPVEIEKWCPVLDAPIGRSK